MAYTQEILVQAGISILRVSGHLDAHTAPELDRALSDLLEMGALRVVLDLADLGYISSAGLGVLTGSLGAFRERGGDLKLAAVPQSAHRVLDLLGFTRLLDLYDTRDDAIAAFARKSPS